MIVEPVTTFLERVNMLEGFKHLAITYFDLEFESTEELFNLANGYLTEDPNFKDETMKTEDSDDEDRSTIMEPNKFGPINGRYFSVLEAEQINTAYAIKMADLDYLKETMFNPNNLATPWLYYNYALFKHVFVWILPHFPTDSVEWNISLCKLLSGAHKINDMFYHWAWYVFPRIMEHYTFVHESIEFLIEAAVTINLEEHVWQGEIDDVSTISLGRRPRPVFQLFWRYAFSNDYQEDAFIKLFKRLKSNKNEKYFDKMWKCWEKELSETRASALWEEPGRTFRLSPGPISYRTVRWNLPFHVFMNGNQVRFTPYIARACKSVTGQIPKVLYDIIELQCYYVTRHSRTTQIIHKLMRERFANDDEEYQRKIKFLRELERTDKRVHW